MFTVDVALAPDVTDVLVDDTAQDLDQRPAGHGVWFNATFDDYETAQQAPTVTLEFYVGAELRYVGHAMPGYCARNCSAGLCPPPDEMRQEIVQFPEGNFDVADFDCLMCIGTGSTSGGCI